MWGQHHCAAVAIDHSVSASISMPACALADSSELSQNHSSPVIHALPSVVSISMCWHTDVMAPTAQRLSPGASQNCPAQHFQLRKRAVSTSVGGALTQNSRVHAQVKGWAIEFTWCGRLARAQQKLSSNTRLSLNNSSLTALSVVSAVASARRHACCKNFGLSPAHVTAGL